MHCQKWPCFIFKPTNFTSVPVYKQLTSIAFCLSGLPSLGNLTISMTLSGTPPNTQQQKFMFQLSIIHKGYNLYGQFGCNNGGSNSLTSIIQIPLASSTNLGARIYHTSDD